MSEVNFEDVVDIKITMDGTVSRYLASLIGCVER